MDVDARTRAQATVTNGIAELVYVVGLAVACHHDPTLPREVEPIEQLRAAVQNLIGALTVVESSDTGRALIADVKVLLTVLDNPTSDAAVVEEFVEKALSFFEPHRVSREQFEQVVVYMARMAAAGQE